MTFLTHNLPVCAIAPPGLQLLSLAVAVATVASLAEAKGPVPGGACKPNAAGCCDYSGEWCNDPESAHHPTNPSGDGIKYVFVQPAGTCVVSGVPHCHNGTVSGDTLTIPCYNVKHGPYTNRTATLELGDGPLPGAQDVLQWNVPGHKQQSSKWYRGGNTGNFTCRTNHTMF